MNIIINNQQKQMAHITDKVMSGERLSLEDGLFLYQSDDLLSIGQLANHVNIQKNVTIQVPC